MKNIVVPDNIHLLRIPPYNPELNPCEQVWQYIKNRFKNQRFESMGELKKWLHTTVVSMSSQTIKSITSNHHYKNAFI
ncbi:transposase [uncultured Nonlabens sp.]|uniref:transposase n=1 Tax=uncultured Nonlabens sp. TaxID=859306 RepID=UPI00345AD4BF